MADIRLNTRPPGGLSGGKGKIYIDFNTNGGNGAVDIDNIILFEAVNSFHVKIQHRKDVMDNAGKFLLE